MTDLYYF